jgi:hypothetical protein
MDPEEFAVNLGVSPPQVKRSPLSHPLAPERSEGVSLGQATREWAVDESKLYVLEQLGRLLGIRIGNRVWFSRAQLVQVLGEPPNGTQPPRLKHLGQGSDVSGRQQMSLELGSLTAAA